MTIKKATDVLEQEHRIIEQAVAAMARLAEDVEQGETVEAEVLRDLLEFLRTFVDQCHHGKEETCLFPLLEKKGVPPTGCPLAALKHEHQSGRALVAQLVEISELYIKQAPKAKNSLIGTLRRLVDLYASHIWKEDYLLFPMANKILSPADQQALDDQFRSVESDIGQDVHHAFEKLASRLEEGVLRD
jgi:hemerythrin-like domain-containing protein